MKNIHNPPVFDEYARYYDLLYRDKDYAAEADYIDGIIKKNNPSANSILELGSGTGIHAKLLNEKGYTVHGIERSPGMIAQSLNFSEGMKNDIDRLAFTQGDIRDTRLGVSFDVVIALFHVISYQTTNEDVVAAFKTAREHLNPGGTFIFDVWYGPAVLTNLPEVRGKRIEDECIKIIRIAEPVLHPNENLVDVNYHIFVRNMHTKEVKEIRETHVMRYFFKPEIGLIADQAGFDVIHAEEWLSGKSVGSDTWGVCFCLKLR